MDGCVADTARSVGLGSPVAAPRRDPGAPRDRDREHLAAVVVGVLADQVHPARRGSDDVGLAPEAIDEQRADALGVTRRRKATSCELGVGRRHGGPDYFE